MMCSVALHSILYLIISYLVRIVGFGMMINMTPVFSKSYTIIISLKFSSFFVPMFTVSIELKKIDKNPMPSPCSLVFYLKGVCLKRCHCDS